MRADIWEPTFEEVEWAVRFATALEGLGATGPLDRLYRQGLKLWKTMGQMMPEDVAEFEHRWMPKGTRVFESVSESRQTLWGSTESLFTELAPAA